MKKFLGPDGLKALLGRLRSEKETLTESISGHEERLAKAETDMEALPTSSGLLANKSFLSSLGVNPTLGVNLAQNSYFCTSLSFNSSFHRYLANASGFVSKLAANSSFQVYLATASGFTSALAGNSGFIAELSSGLLANKSFSAISDKVADLEERVNALELNGGTGDASPN